MIQLRQPALALHAHDVHGYKYQMSTTWQMPSGALAHDLVFWIKYCVDRSPELMLKNVVINCHGLPASTARGWLKKSAIEVVSLDVLDLDTVRLQHEVVQLRRRVTKLTTLLRLAIVIARVTSFPFHRIRIADGDDKQRLLTAIGRTRSHVGVRTVLRAIGLSQARYNDWNRDECCTLDDRTSCPRNSPQQLTRQEVNVIREMVTSPEYRHVPTSSLARLAQRLGKVFASVAA